MTFQFEKQMIFSLRLPGDFSLNTLQTQQPAKKQVVIVFLSKSDLSDFFWQRSGFF